MTPEAAHGLGKRAAFNILDHNCACFDATTAGLMRDMEHAAEEDLPVGDFDALKPHYLRGCAAHFRELIDEIEARAAALESTR